MDEIAKTIMSAKRRKFIRSRFVFVRQTSVSETELFRLATSLNFKFVTGLAKWLLLAGYGVIDETLNFQENLFDIIKDDPQSERVSFAQDTAGNRYAFAPKDGSIYFISQQEKVATRIADNFLSFMQELIRRDYRLQEWVAGLTPPVELKGDQLQIRSSVDQIRRGI